MGDVDVLEMQLKIRVDGENALKSAKETTKAVGGAATQASREVDSYVKTLERQAAMAGKSTREQLELKRTFALQDYGKNAQQIEKINKAFDQLDRSIEKPKVQLRQMKTRLEEFAESSEEKFKSFGEVMGNSLVNPLQTVQQGVTGLLRYIGPGGMIAAGATVGLGIVAKEAYEMARSFAEGEHQTMLFAERLGVTAGQARELERASQLAGVNVYALEGSARMLSQALDDTSGNGARASKVLRDLKIDTRGAGGETREMGDVLLELMDKLSQTENHTKMVSAATTLLGRGAKEILPLIKNYQEYKRTLEEMGVSFDTNAIEKSAKTMEEFHKLDIAWTELMRAFKAKIEPIVVPVVIKLAGWMTSDHSRTAPEFQHVENAAGGVETNGFSIDAIRNGVMQILAPIAPLDLRRALTKNNPYLPQPGTGAGAAAGAAGTIDSVVAKAKADSKRFNDAMMANDAEAIKKRVEQLKQNNNELREQLGSDKLLGADRAAKQKEYEENKKQIEQLEKRAKAVEAMPGLLESMRQKAVDAETKESTGLEKINAEYEKEIAHLKQIGALTPATRALAVRVRDAEARKFNQQVSAERAAQNRRSATGLEEVNASYARAVAGSFDEAFVRETQGPYAAISGAFANKVGGADAEFAAAGRRINAMRQESAAREAIMHDQIALEKELGNIRVEQIKAAGKYAEDYYKASFDRTKALQALEIEKLKTDREIANVQISMDRTAAQQGFNLAQRRATILARPGEETIGIENEYKARVDLANKIASIEIKHIALEKDGNKQRLDAANLIKDVEQQISEAALDREVKLLELQHKRFEEARSEAGKLASGILGGGNGIRGFFVGQAKDLAHGVLTNILTPIMESAMKKAGDAIPGQRDASGKLTPLGRILQGTLLGSHESPELKAQKEVKGAIDTSNDFLSQIRDLIASAMGYTPAGGGYSSAGGYTPIGSTGSGLGGVLGSAGRAASSPGSPGFLKGVGGFLGGLVSGPISGLGGVIKDFSNPDVSWAQWAGKAVGLGAGVAAGVFETMNNFRQGGARGIAGGIGSAAATAAMLDPEPISKAVLTVIATAGTLVKSVFGDPKAERERHLTDTLERDTYRAPLSQNITQSMNGTYQDFDVRGNLRTTPYRAVPSMLEPFAAELQVNGQYNWYEYPGAVGRPFQGPIGGSGQMPTGNNLNVTINTLDPIGFHDYMQRNSRAVGEALATHLQSHDGRAADAIRFIVGAGR